MSKVAKFGLDSFTPDMEPIPRVNLIEREPEPVAESKELPPAARAKAAETAMPSPGAVDHTQALRTQRFLPKSAKRGTSLRLEPWLEDALAQHFYKLQMDGYRKVTREAIISEALMLYLGVTRPAGAE
jgi:hypothetical protein